MPYDIITYFPEDSVLNKVKRKKCKQVIPAQVLGASTSPGYLNDNKLGKNVFLHLYVLICRHHVCQEICYHCVILYSEMYV